MKLKKLPIGIWGSFTLLVLTLSACKVNIKTDIDRNSRYR